MLSIPGVVHPGHPGHCVQGQKNWDKKTVNSECFQHFNPWLKHLQKMLSRHGSLFVYTSLCIYLRKYGQIQSEVSAHFLNAEEQRGARIPFKDVLRSCFRAANIQHKIMMKPIPAWFPPSLLLFINFITVKYYQFFGIFGIFPSFTNQTLHFQPIDSGHSEQ